MLVNRRELGVLYVGPIRVEISVRFVGGLLAITQISNNQVIAYPRPHNGLCFAEVVLDDYPPNLQSAFRREETLKKWTALMQIMGEIWEGSMSYNWGLNSVYCHLERLE